jgi:DDE superfamily endonuclease
MSSKAKQPGRLVRRPPASGRRLTRRLKAGDVAIIGDELIAFQRQYHSVLQRREQRHCSMFYLCGQLSGLERKTIEPMVMALDGPDLNAIRALQQFIGQSPWSSGRLRPASKKPRVKSAWTITRRAAGWAGIIICCNRTWPISF